MRRSGGLIAVGVALAAVFIATRRNAPPVPGPAPYAPDTAVAGRYVGRAPSPSVPWATIELRLAGTMTARMESTPAGAAGPVVDTGAWTKDDGGAVVVTLAPRDTSTDSGDTLRFAVRGDSLVSEDRLPGAEALTLTRSR